jgi:hypothetical protein
MARLYSSTKEQIMRYLLDEINPNELDEEKRKAFDEFLEDNLIHGIILFLFSCQIWIVVRIYKQRE